MNQKKIPSALRNVTQEIADQIYDLIRKQKMDEAVCLYSKESGLSLEEAKVYVDEEQSKLDLVREFKTSKVQKEALEVLKGKTSAIVMGLDDEGQGTCYIHTDDKDIFGLLKMLLIQKGKVGQVLRQAAGAGLAESIARNKLEKALVGRS